ncbi:probable fatty acid elongase (FEN1) [Rhynchosporium agropyri]|uniref:Elongation of fatty acids protein n=1 Tax=Rhynchosporium agropyri TaxID=914238 RepID=A0A1E1L3X1_9HELO|nr:probable fatty acid elongase (FEN1) [Rhynchosporium agropyri]
MSYSNNMTSTHIPAVVPISLSPWANFNKVWTSIMGYPAEDFRFVPGKTSFSTLKETVFMIVLYVVVIFGGRELMRNREPFKLNGLFKVHNFFLTFVSGSLLVLFAEQLLPSLWKGGLYENICGASGWTQPLVVLYYLNYLVKYIELIDTVFLMVKKKPLTFLHTYHHPATALLCYTQLIGHTSVSWVPITLNLMVHVVMYWYYFQSARGIKVSWKKWITRLQITQFVIDLGFVYFASWDYFTSTYAPYLPHVGTCAGEPWAAIAGDVILSSYLVLFISFYIATYKKMSNKRSAAKVAQRAEGKMEKAELPTIKETADKATHAVKAANGGNHNISPSGPFF